MERRREGGERKDDSNQKDNKQMEIYLLPLLSSECHLYILYMNKHTNLLYLKIAV